MLRWIWMIGWVAVAAVASEAQTPQGQVVPPFEVYSQRVLNRWQEVNGILIEPAAQRRILNDVNRQRPAIRAWQRIQADSPEEQSLLIELQRQYCFDLRDRQVRRLAGSPKGGAALLNVQVSSAKPAITERDVEASPFQQAVEWLMKTVGPREVGYLEITTPKPGAGIYFGNDARPSGMTSRNFVMGVGTYLVRIAPGGVPECAQKIEIRPRERTNFACPQPKAAGGAD